MVGPPLSIRQPGLRVVPGLERRGFGQVLQDDLQRAQCGPIRPQRWTGRIVVLARRARWILGRALGPDPSVPGIWRPGPRCLGGEVARVLDRPMEPPPWCLEQWFGDSSYADKLGQRNAFWLVSALLWSGGHSLLGSGPRQHRRMCRRWAEPGAGRRVRGWPGGLTGLSVLAGPPSNVTARGRVMVLLGTIGLMAAVVGLVAYPR